MLTTILRAGMAVAFLSLPAFAQEPQHSVHTLPASKADLIFNGEMASREWAVYLTPGELIRPLSFQVASLTAVSALPEHSRLQVQVNGETVLEKPLQATSDFAVSSVKLPQGLVQPGFNAVRISVTQRHRVDCSMQATYELWTALDRLQTGFVRPLDAVPTLRDLADLASVPVAEDGTTHIRLRTTETTDEASLGRALRVVQALVRVGQLSRPVVEVNPEAGTGPGIDLFVGTSGAAGALPGGVRGMPARGITVDNDAASGRAQVTVIAASPNEFGLLVGKIEAEGGVAPKGTPEGLRARRVAAGTVMESDSTVTLADLGEPDSAFAGRFFRKTVAVALPSDFVPADYARARLILNATYQGGLLPQSRVHIRVNGRFGSSIDLDAAEGAELRDRGLEIPLRLFRPGVNQVVIEANTRNLDDEICDPAAINSSPRFTLLSSTGLEIPALARAGRMPEIAATLATGFPKADDTVDLYVASQDPATLGAAATFAAHLGTSPDGGIVRVRFGIPAETATGIVVGSLDRIPPALAARIAALADGPAAAAAEAKPAKPEGQLAWLLRGVDRVLREHGFVFSDEELAGLRPVVPVSGLVVAQFASGQLFSADVRTVITARGTQNLEYAMANAVARSAFDTMSGEIASFDAASGDIRRAAAESQITVLSGPFSANNTRLLAAGLFSSNLPVHVSLVLLICILLGTATLIAVRQLGVRE